MGSREGGNLASPGDKAANPPRAKPRHPQHPQHPPWPRPTAAGLTRQGQRTRDGEKERGGSLRGDMGKIRGDGDPKETWTDPAQGLQRTALYKPPRRGMQQRTGLVCHRGGMCIIHGRSASPRHPEGHTAEPPAPSSHRYFGPRFLTWALAATPPGPAAPKGAASGRGCSALAPGPLPAEPRAAFWSHPPHIHPSGRPRPPGATQEGFFLACSLPRH